MEQLNDLDYENIENAVMETARGRWFLAEFKKRNSGAGTPKILEAIAKLEKVVREIGTVSKPGPAAVTMPDVNAKRKEAAETGTAKSCDEKTVIAPLQRQPDALSDDNLQFFANDEELFADTTPPTPAVTTQESTVTTTFAPIEAKPEKPANERFKVFRTQSTHDDEVKNEDLAAAPEAGTDESVESVEAMAPTPSPQAPEIPDPAMTATQDEKDRIVVIRNSATADIEIPLVGQDEDPVTKPADA